jgi:hypothetical protein
MRSATIQAAAVTIVLCRVVTARAMSKLPVCRIGRGDDDPLPLVGRDKGWG